MSGMGNRPNTRMLKLYKQISFKVEWAAHRYRTAWSALIILDPGGEWQSRLQVLQREDI
jgi:hypothetical protein